jgi:hypothetical protein
MASDEMWRAAEAAVVAALADQPMGKGTRLQRPAAQVAWQVYAARCLEVMRAKVGGATDGDRPYRNLALARMRSRVRG